MWTEARIEILKADCLTIMSAREICDDINAKTGSTFSRNAIIGKAARMGLMKDKPKNQPREAKENVGKMANRKTRELNRVARTGKGFMVRTCFMAESVAPAIDSTAPASLDMSIFDLGEKHCRFPVSGEGWQTLFCGNDKHPGSSYCPHHHSVCCL